MMAAAGDPSRMGLAYQGISRFLNSSTLKSPSQRKYACAYCGKRFVRNAELERHVRIHLGIRPFQCTVCHKSFVQKISAIRHIQRVHHQLGDALNFVIRVA